MSWTYLTFKQAGWYLNFNTRFKKAVLQAGLILGQGYIPAQIKITQIKHKIPI